MRRWMVVAMALVVGCGEAADSGESIPGWELTFLNGSGGAQPVDVAMGPFRVLYCNPLDGVGEVCDDMTGQYVIVNGERLCWANDPTICELEPHPNGRMLVYHQ